LDKCERQRFFGRERTFVAGIVCGEGRETKNRRFIDWKTALNKRQPKTKSNKGFL